MFTFRNPYPKPHPYAKGRKSGELEVNSVKRGFLRHLRALREFRELRVLPQSLKSGKDFRCV